MTRKMRPPAWSPPSTKPGRRRLCTSATEDVETGLQDEQDRTEHFLPSCLSRSPVRNAQRVVSLMIQLKVNGKHRDVEQPASLLALLEQIGVDPRIVAVEHNGEIVKRTRFGE